MTIFGRFTRRLCLAVLLLTAPAFGRPNFNIELLSDTLISGTEGCWGYVDSATNKEYALICATNRLEIWDVTNPINPSRIRSVATAGNGDLKQVRPYKNYVIAVNQNGGSRRAALQVIDVSNPSLAHTTAVWPDTGNTLPNGAHTVHIDGDFAYLGMNGVAAEWYEIDISNPLNPTEVPGGTYLTPYGGQAHDSYVKGDTGYIAFLDGGFSIVAKKGKPVFEKVADSAYPGAFTHNCWPTEDHKYLFTTDEVPGGHLRVWDIRDPTKPTQVAEWMPPGIVSIIHNVQVKGNYLYASYYADGVVILDIEDPTQPVEVGHFDTAPQAPSSGNYAGCWDFFPYFPSGTLLASNYTGPPGMWLLRFDTTRAGKLRGRVTNWETGDSIPDATVRFLNIPRQTKTDSSGNYVIRTEGGSVRLEFSAPSFRPETVTVNAVFNDVLELDTVRLVPVSLLPTTPQNLTARPVDGGNIPLFWQKPPDPDLVEFRIYRTALSDTTAFSLLASLNPAETSYTDVGGAAGERFFYRVTSVNQLGFESFISSPVKAMRFVFGPRLLLVNRTGPAIISAHVSFRDSVQNFYLRALRRYDFDTLNLKDESFSLPAGIPPNFVTRNRVIYVNSAELWTSTNDNPTFLSYFTDFLKAGGRLVMDGHWALGRSDKSFLKCLPIDAPFSISPGVWDTLRNVFGFDCIFFPRIVPFDTSLVNRSFLSAQPERPGYPLLIADSGRAAEGFKTFISPTLSYGFPTVPNIGYFTNRDPGEDLYRFGSIYPEIDPKQGQTVAKKHMDPVTGGGLVWFNFPLFYMQEDSAKKAIRRALTDLGVLENFPKGDLNRNGMKTILDVIYLTNFIFHRIPFQLFDSDEADMNCDGQSSPADLVMLLLNVFSGQPLPCN